MSRHSWRKLTSHKPAARSQQITLKVNLFLYIQYIHVHEHTLLLASLLQKMYTRLIGIVFLDLGFLGLELKAGRLSSFSISV